MANAFVILLCFGWCSMGILGIPESLLYPQDRGDFLPVGDDLSVQVDFVDPISFYGEKFQTVYVSTKRERSITIFK